MIITLTSKRDLEKVIIQGVTRTVIQNNLLYLYNNKDRRTHEIDLSLYVVEME